MIELFPNDIDEIRLEFFVFDKLIIQNDTFRHNYKLAGLRQWSKNDVRDIKNDSNAIVVLFIYVKEVYSDQMI